MFRPLLATLGAIALAATLSTAPAAASPAAASPPDGPNPGLSSIDDFSSNPAYAQYYEQKLRWGACVDDRGEEVLPHVQQCAILTAPMNWANPAQGDLSLLLSRAIPSPATTSTRRLLLSNPGGPGGPGLFFSEQMAQELGLTAEYDAVSVNPRGVAPGHTVKGDPRTAAAFNCGTLAANIPAPDPTDIATFTRESFRTRTQSLEAHYAQCFAKNPVLAGSISTPNTVRDFNLARAVLGYATTDFFGHAYGTWLGSVFSRMFPTRVDRVVLRANMNWQSGSFSTGFSYKTQSFQWGFDQAALPWLARRDAQYHLGTTPSAVADQMKTLRAQAVQRGVSGTYFDFLQVGLIQSIHSTPQGILEVLVGLAKGTVQPEPTMHGLMKNFATLTHDVFRAVSCNDSGNAGTAMEAADRNFDNAQKHPVFTVGAWMNTNCTGWPAPAQITSDLLQRPVGKVLMLHNEDDSNTMYRGALATRRNVVGTARMLLVDDGHGHTADLQDPCVRRHTVAWLRDGVFPDADVHCQAGPLPGEREIYEFNQPASSEKPLVEMAPYGERNLSMPPVDADATAAWQAANPGPTSPPVRRDSARERYFRDQAERDPLSILRF